MAYSDDIVALNPDHHWVFDGDYTDSVGSANGTNTGMSATGAPIAEDSTNSIESDAVGDRVTIPDTSTINNSAQAQKAVAGWFLVTAIQDPPKRIYGEGNESTCFQFVLAWGNNVMFEVTFSGTSLQVYGDTPLVPNRPYHLCGIFDGNGGGNEIRFYLDGVEQLAANPSDRQPDAATLPVRGAVEFGDPLSNVGVGGSQVLLNAPVNGRWSHWAAWDGSDAILTDTEVREELFEKGALPSVTISTGTEGAMQTALDALADTTRPNAPLCIRVEDVTGSGDLTLDADNITFDALASIHVQWMGTGTLTWRNENGSNASIGSTPNGGTIIFATPVTVQVTARDASDSSTVGSARVLLEADTGGDLAVGTTILDATANGSGVASVTFDYTNPQPVVGRVRKGSSSPYYKTADISGTITSNGLDISGFMEPDE